MIKVFFDSEFTGLHQNTTLISIGMISDKGDTFYAEFNDYDESQCDDWIRENVIANLKFSAPSEGEAEYFVWSKNGTSVELRGNKSQIAQYVADWFQDIQGGPVSWVDYGDNPPRIISDTTIELWSDWLAYDFVLFNQLYGHAFNIPECVYYIPFDICTLFKVAGINPDISREQYAGCVDGAEKHNALFDAKIIKICHHLLCGLKGMNKAA